MEILYVFNTMLCVIILYQSLKAINRMTPKTSHLLRVAYIFTAVVALGVIITPISKSEYFQVVGLLINVLVLSMIALQYMDYSEHKENPR